MRFHFSSPATTMINASAENNFSGASIIGIASLTSFFAHEMVPGYGAAKTGVVQLSKTLRISWAKHGIRANAIAAGLIETRMTSMMKGIPEMNDPIMARTPMKRWGTPEGIANAALFLASRFTRWPFCFWKVM